MIHCIRYLSQTPSMIWPATHVLSIFAYRTQPYLYSFRNCAESRIDIDHLDKHASALPSFLIFAMIVRSYHFSWGWLCALVCWLVIVASADCYDMCPLHLGESDKWEMVEGREGGGGLGPGEAGHGRPKGAEKSNGDGNVDQRGRGGGEEASSRALSNSEFWNCGFGKVW